MKAIITTKKFEKDLKKIAKNDKNVLKNLKIVLNKLQNNQELDKKYKDHKLIGEWHFYRELHIKNDLLLIYQSYEEEVCLYRIGSHSELFKKF